MAWVRTDGRKIADDPALLQQGKSDVAACDANLDNEPSRACPFEFSDEVRAAQHAPPFYADTAATYQH
jgi:hypothetical protein